MSKVFLPNDIGTHRIGEAIPPDWAATSTVYSKLFFDFSKGVMSFSYSPVSMSYSETDIGKFLTALFDNTLPPGAPVPLVPPVGRPCVLDMSVADRCYFVIEIDESVKWQFHATGVGLTTLLDYGDSNAQLRHFKKTPQGYVALPNVDPGEGCTLVYFSVVYRDAGARQKFNFHIQLTQRDQTTDYKPLGIVIDPDIGNGGPVPPPPPP